jgi:hypothetical protein
MISIPITHQACEALKARIPGIDQARLSQGGNGTTRIWVDRKIVDRLLELRSAGESYSDVILRLAAARVNEKGPDAAKPSGPLGRRVGGVETVSPHSSPR